MTNAIAFGGEPYTKYDERDLVQILPPLEELKRAIEDAGVDVMKELPFERSKRTIRSILNGKRNVKIINGQVQLQPKYEIAFRRILEREKALISESEQVKKAVEKLLLSMEYLKENKPSYGRSMINLALRQCMKYSLQDEIRSLRVARKYIKTSEGEIEHEENN